MEKVIIDGREVVFIPWGKTERWEYLDKTGQLWGGYGGNREQLIKQFKFTVEKEKL